LGGNDENVAQTTRLGPKYVYIHFFHFYSFLTTILGFIYEVMDDDGTIWVWLGRNDENGAQTSPLTRTGQMTP
jgi:hypothetical protein